ncbi:hypothetical protein AKJ41_00480 [candidate division MSBL1 archaeon SCGC-AAA259O05]|uniref:precorrin-2 dehydrogenase n=1 Tax=candidate division MSBL1 archaeon SCGC-AAA259O05 TaxID=1698271 RepID=A0A133V5M0_9EURY|nr:hypothetical protein AKJ41_00480 [candidate division MSBL1 archaeon SCGC-AAA259O05]
MYLPLYINMEGRKAIVFGLGNVGRRRAEKLRDSGADVVGIDRRNVDIDGIDTLQRKLTPDSIPPLDDYFLAVAATSDSELNSLIARKAEDEGVLVNQAGDSGEGDVIFPAVTRAGGGKISVTTLGDDPSLAREAKELLENEVSKD